jgi:hypothetical protein
VFYKLNFLYIVDEWSFVCDDIAGPSSPIELETGRSQLDLFRARWVFGTKKMIGGLKTHHLAENELV